MSSKLLFLAILIAIIDKCFSNESLDEESLFFDFPSNTAHNWTGLEGWKIVANNRNGMHLNGPPDNGGKYHSLRYILLILKLKHNCQYYNIKHLLSIYVQIFICREDTESCSGNRKGNHCKFDISVVECPER